jgi:hypothetical protein
MHEPKRVIVIGCGGIGGNFGRFLIPALEYNAQGSTVLYIDGDAYEPKNAERQSFSKLGNKAQVLRLDTAMQYPNTIVIAKAAWVVPEGEQVELVEGEEGIARLAPSQFMNEGDHVFVLVDNFATRKTVFDAAQAYENIDVYTGGNDEELLGSIYHYCRRNGEDVTPHPAVFHEEIANPPDKNPGTMSCEERAKIEGGTQIAAINMAVAAQLLAKVSWYILGTEEQQAISGRIIEGFFDLADCSAAPRLTEVLSPVTEPELVSAASE